MSSNSIVRKSQIDDSLVANVLTLRLVGEATADDDVGLLSGKTV